MSFELTSGIQQKPIRAVLYGPEGIGKTTFAADFLKARSGALIDTESGSAYVDVMRYPVPSSWDELLAMVKDATMSKSIHAIGIDTLDRAELLCADALCKSQGWQSLESPKYGAGYRYCWSKFNDLLSALNQAIQAGKDVICIAHAIMRKFEQPDQMGAYDRWELKLQNSPKCSISAAVKEWSDLLLFANYETIVLTSADGKTKKAAGGKKRVMYTSHHPCWDAKNRFSLPEKMDFSFSSIAGLFIPSETGLESPQKPVKAEPEQSAPVATEAPTKGNSGAKKTTSKKQAKEPPKEESKPDPAPPDQADDRAPTVTPEDVNGLCEELGALMLRDQISIMELRVWSAQQGYFDMSIPVNSWDPDYLSMYLPSVWDKIVTEIREARKSTPF